MNLEVFKNTYKELNEFAESCVKDMRNILDHTDSLKNDIDFVINITNTGYIVSFRFPDYGIFVHSGRRAGAKMPPISAIEDWAKNKGIEQFRIQKSWKSAGSNAGRWISNRSRAFLIARAIGRRGIKPIPFLDVPSNRSGEVASLVGSGFTKDYAITMQNIFNKAGIGK